MNSFSLTQILLINILYIGNIFKGIYFHQITKTFLVITVNDKLFLMKIS